MKIRGLLVAVALLVVLAGGIWYTSHKEKDKALGLGEKGANTPILLTLKVDDIVHVEIARQAGETTVLDKDVSGAWKLIAPTAYPVDRDAAGSLITSIATVASDKIVDEKAADTGQYGLKPPSVTVTVRLKDGKTKKVFLGDSTVIGSGVYAALEGDARVYTVATSTKDSLDKTAADLRDRRMLTVDFEKLARVVLSAHKTEIEFGKNAGGEWQILKPKPYRADVFSVDDLVRRLKEVKLDPAVSADDAKKMLAAFNSAAPVATLTATDAAVTQKLEIRKAKDEKFYARSSAVEGTYTVDAATATAFDRTTDDFRNKRVFDFGFGLDEPSRVDYRSAKSQATVSRSGEKWFRSGKALDSASIQTLLDKLRGAAATKFAESGFGSAEIEIGVVSADGKRTEKVSLAKSGQDWLARREGDASLYVIPGATVDEFERAVAGLKEEPGKPPAKK